MNVISAIVGWQSAAFQFRFDAFASHWFGARLTPTFAWVLGGMSDSAAPGWVASAVVVCAVILLSRRRWRPLVMLMLVVPGGALLGQLIKIVVQRQRPFPSGPFGEWGGYSFPSGHTISATLLYGAMVLILAPIMTNRLCRMLLAVTALLAVLTVAFSRVALGAHYVTDVAAAMGIGGLWTLLCARVTRDSATACLPCVVEV